MKTFRDWTDRLEWEEMIRIDMMIRITEKELEKRRQDEQEYYRRYAQAMEATRSERL